MKIRSKPGASVVWMLLFAATLLSAAADAHTQSGTAGIGSSSPEGLECFTFSATPGGQANFRVWWTGFSDYLVLIVTCDLHDEEAWGWSMPYDDRVLVMSLALPPANKCWACVGLDLAGSATDSERFKINLKFAFPQADKKAGPELVPMAAGEEVPAAMVRTLERLAETPRRKEP